MEVLSKYQTNEPDCLPARCTSAKVKAGSLWKLQRTDLKAWEVFSYIKESCLL